MKYGSDAVDYSTDVLRDKALAFVEANPDAKLFVYFAPFAPHVGGPSANYLPVPAPRHAGTFAGLPRWTSPSYLESDMSDKPAWAQGLPLPSQTEEAFLQLQRRRALESLLAVDEAVGSLIALLEAQGRIDRTAIIFTSDNGYSDGEHRWAGKTMLWKEQTQVPFLVRLPEPLADPGSRRSQLALNIDIAPTVLALADGLVPTRVDGVSLLPVLQDATLPGRRSALFERWASPTSKVPVDSLGLLSGDLKYIVHSTGERELYDLRTDPFELESFVDRADPCQLVALEQEMLARGGTLPFIDGGAPAAADGGCETP